MTDFKALTLSAKSEIYTDIVYYNKFCNNCGKYGHIYNKCKNPITSNGIIAFRYGETELEYLLIRRRNSLGFIEFMRGKYNIYNKQYLLNIINEMTIEEKRLLLIYNFEQLWENIWGDNSSIIYRGEEKMSKEKFQSLKLPISVNFLEYNLESLIIESSTEWTEPEWGFPKGRRDYKETDLQSAIREFEEETLYNREKLNIIKNVIPYEEIFTGSNYKSYKHKYYLAHMNIDLTDFNKNICSTEVSKMDWLSYENACSLIRPYNLEKLSILNKVNTILIQYRLYS
jgi:8-oxo-dGTP pyrophosphatase MutT (NUDIX family)